MFLKFIFILLSANLLNVEMARILVVFPTPSVSHQVEIQPLSEELARRGHEVVVMTAYPAYEKGKTPTNLTEISMKEIAYAIKKNEFAERATGKAEDIVSQIKAFFELFENIFEGELRTKEVQEIINDKDQHFDLLIIEACVRSALVFSHIYKAPVILFSTIGSLDMFTEYTGAAMHPLLYPSCLHQKLSDLTLREKAQELYKHYLLEEAIESVESLGDEILRRNFGPDVPPLKELKKNVNMLFLSEYHVWDNHRPVPPATVYLGGIYPSKTRELPKDLKSFLDSSKNGVIYMSLGTNVNSGFLSQHTIKSFVEVFSQLPYEVLLKWDLDELPGASKNVKIAKWFPQSDLLNHPNIKLFIMQGGLQSTSDAIAAAVPVLAIPMLGDQWYNAEQFKRFKIGQRLDMESLTTESMLKAIKIVIEDDSYKRNMVEFRDRVRDQPQSGLERAVWWCEYVIRHKGAAHLKAPTALISRWDYFEIDLLLAASLYGFLLLTLIVAMIYALFHFGRKFVRKAKVD